MKGLRGNRPIPRIDEECLEATAVRWVAEAGVPICNVCILLHEDHASAKGSGHSVSWRSNFVKAIMNYLSQQECLMKWTGRRLMQTLAVLASDNSMKEKAAPILKHFIDPEIVKVIINI